MILSCDINIGGGIKEVLIFKLPSKYMIKKYGYEKALSIAMGKAKDIKKITFPKIAK